MIKIVINMDFIIDCTGRMIIVNKIMAKFIIADIIIVIISFKPLFWDVNCFLFFIIMFIISNNKLNEKYLFYLLFIR